MLSFHNFFELIGQKDAFLSPIAHKKTGFREKKIFMIIFVIVFLILPQIQSIQTPPSPYYNYSPQLIQSGKVNFIKGTSVDNDPSTVFSSTYTVTLTRMKNTDPSDYLVIVGYKHMHIDVITYTPAALSYIIYCYNKGVSSFQCFGYSSHEALFTRYQLSYMAISKKVGNIYLLDKLFILDKILVYPVYEDFVITDSSIKQIGQNYHYVLSVYHFYTGVVTTANPNAFLPQLVINSTSTYTIRMYSNGLFLHSIGIQVLLFDPASVNDLTRTNIIITHHYNHPGPVGNFDAIVYSYSGILMSSLELGNDRPSIFTKTIGKIGYFFIDKVNNSLVEIDSHLMSVQNNQISILINYDVTIQCQKSRLELNFTETKYLPDFGNYTFKMCGTNQPLIHSQYTDLFMTTEYVYLGIGALMVLLLCASFYSPKYIGLQAILTLQLIYYSCLLVKNLDLMPPGFRTFVSFKYSTGFNQLFKFTKILITGDLEKKIVWINLEKTIIENYNTSFVILVLSSIFMVFGFVYRKAYQGQFEGRSDKFSNHELKNIEENLRFSTKINQLSSSIYNQVSVWSILQIIAAVSLQLLIDPKSTLISEKSQLFNFQPLIAIVSVFFVIWAGLSNLKNLLHSDVSWGKYVEQMNVLQYRRLNFMYLIVVGFVIFFLNQKTLFELIPASTIVLAIHLLYIILLHVINPYQHSLNVHKYGLYFCQIVYLLFLVCVNVINFASNLNEILILGFVYFIVFCCVVIVIFTIVRLYYEYKYGEKLEKKIQKERQLAKQAQIDKQEAQILRKMKKLQNQITSSLTKKQQKRIQNVYLLQNQIRQELMVDQIEFLDRRPQLNEQQKQIYYFKKFHTKPLHYLKKNNIQEFNKRLNELSEKKKADQQKRQLKKQDPNYVQVTQRLKKQLHQLSRVQNYQAKSMKKKTQKSTLSN